MQKLTMTALLATALTAAAQDAPPTLGDVCAQTSKNARSLMKSRQDGVAVETMMAPVLASKAGPVQDFMREMVLHAYEKPRFTTPQVQEGQVEDFGNAYYIACMRKGGPAKP